jgi:hypothetical protein
MTAKSRNQAASVQELVERFTSIAAAQYDAIQKDHHSRYNRLYAQMEEVRGELKSCDGDQRRALIPLLKSNNSQLRLKAAITLLAVAPDLARKALESVRDSGIFPQCADAGMMLDGIDDGSYVPS